MLQKLLQLKGSFSTWKNRANPKLARRSHSEAWRACVAHAQGCGILDAASSVRLRNPRSAGYRLAPRWFLARWQQLRIRVKDKRTRHQLCL